MKSYLNGKGQQLRTNRGQLTIKQFFVPALANTGSSPRFACIATPLAPNTTVTRAHHGFTRTSRTGSSTPASSTPCRSVLLFAKKKQTSSHRYPWVIPTVHPQWTPLVSHIQRSTSASRLSRMLSTGSSIVRTFPHHRSGTTIAKQQAISCLLYHRVIPPVLPSLSVTYRPYRG